MIDTRLRNDFACHKVKLHLAYRQRCALGAKREEKDTGATDYSPCEQRTITFVTRSGNEIGHGGTLRKW